MSQFTHGPWFVHEDDYTPEPRVTDGHGKLIAKLIMLESEYPDRASVPDVVTANAALIAAAPDLLAALKAVVGMVEAYHEVPPTRAKQARAAIERAEGRSA